MILVAFRHGLRSSELTDLRWDQVDFVHAVLHVRRAKKGVPSTHPIRGDELRALRKLQREQEPKSPFVFTSERNSPFSTGGFARMMERAGVEAKLGFKAHPHMLRHACGFALANATIPGPSQSSASRKQPLIPLDDALPAGTFQFAAELGRLFGGSERADHGAVIDPLVAEIGALDDRRTGPNAAGNLFCSAR